MSNQLLPCPFCGSSKVHEMRHEDIDFVQCRACFSSTRPDLRMEEAVEIWNRRSTQPAAGEPIGWLRLEPDDNETASYHFYPHLVEGSAPVCFVNSARNCSVPNNWQPIECAPLDNKRPLFIAQFSETGELIDLDWDATWEAERESFDIPKVYYVWRSAMGRVEEPTHFAYMDAPPAAATVAAGEPVAEFFVEFATLRRAMSIYGLSAPESNHELGSQMERYAIRVIEAVAKLPFPYPPAAAHGDEADGLLRAAHQYAWEWRKRAADARKSLDQAIELLEKGIPYVSAWNIQNMILSDRMHEFVAAMRAQGDGE